MGLHFGQLAKIRGIVTYKLSQHEQRAFAGFITHAIPNTFRRIRENFFMVVPPFVVSYIVYTQVEKRHEELSRKNPADFECDE